MNKIMVFLFSIFLTFFAQGAAITPGANIVSTYTMGGVTLPTAKTIFLTGNASASQHDTFRRSGTFYQVPAGKSLIIRAFRCYDTTNTTNSGFSLGYADVAVSNQLAAPTGVQIIGLGGGGSSWMLMTNYQTQEGPVYAVIPAGKYPLIKAISVSFCTFIGEEV